MEESYLPKIDPNGYLVSDLLATPDGSIFALLHRTILKTDDGGSAWTVMDIQTSPTGVLGQPNGAFTFGVNFSQQNPLTAATGSGNEIADVLLGYPSSGSLTWNSPTFVTMHYYGAYIQDNYKVLPSLSLTAGLRWDINLSPQDRHDRINAGFCLTCTNPYTSQINYANAPSLQNPLLGGLQFAGVGGIPNAPFENHWNNWQPRVGFSWAPLTNTVVRGGYGIFSRGHRWR